MADNPEQAQEGNVGVVEGVLGEGNAPNQAGVGDGNAVPPPPQQQQNADVAQVVVAGVPPVDDGVGDPLGINPVLLAQLNQNAAAEEAAANPHPPHADAQPGAGGGVGAAADILAAMAAAAAAVAAGGPGGQPQLPAGAGVGAAVGGGPGGQPPPQAGAGQPGAGAGAAGGQPPPQAGAGQPGAGAGAAGGQPPPQAGGQPGAGAGGQPPPQAGGQPGAGAAGGPGIRMTPEEIARLFAAMAPLFGAAAAGGAGNNARKKPEVKLAQFTSALPQDWRDFRKLADNAKVTNQWTDEEAKRVVFSKCVGEAGKRVRLVPFGSDPTLVPRPADAKTYEQYMSDLQIRFQPKGASSLAFSDFIKAIQLPDEDFQGWHTRLEGLFCLAEPDENPQTAKLLLRKWITGLKDKVIADFLLDRSPTSYAQALDLAQEKQGNLYLARQENPKSGGRSASSFINSVGTVDSDDAEEYADVMVHAINYPTGERAVSTKSANKNLRRFGPDYANKLQSGASCDKCGANHPTSWCTQVPWGRRIERNDYNKRVHFRDGSRPPPGPRQKGRGRPANNFNRGRGRGNGQRGGRGVSALSDHFRQHDDIYEESLAAMQACTRMAMNEGN